MNRQYIDNDELYQKHPRAHEVAINSFSEQVTEETYPAVEGWYVEMGPDGVVDGIYEPVFADWYQQKTKG